MPGIQYYAQHNFPSGYFSAKFPAAPVVVGKTPVLLLHQYGLPFPQHQAGMYNSAGDPDNTPLWSITDDHKTVAGATGPYEYIVQWWDHADTGIPDHYIHFSQDDSFLDVDRDSGGILPGVTKIADTSGYGWTLLNTNPINNGDTITTLQGIRSLATDDTYYDFNHLTMTRANVWNGIGGYRVFTPDSSDVYYPITGRPVNNAAIDNRVRGCRLWAIT